MSNVQPDWMPQGVRPVLGVFDGKQVLSTSIAITNAGDGLSAAMAIDPQELHLGETVIVVSECVVAKVRFDPIKDTEGVQRVHVLKAGTSTIMEGEVVKAALTAQAEKLRLAAQIAKGQHALPTPENLQAEHDAGAHAEGLIVGCPACDNEAEVHAADRAAEIGDQPAVAPTSITEGAARKRTRPSRAIPKDA